MEESNLVVEIDTNVTLAGARPLNTVTTFFFLLNLVFSII